MLVHLISDLIKDQKLKTEFSQDPISVVKRYGITDFSSIQSDGFDAIINQISSEIKESFAIPSFLGWPNTNTPQIYSISPNSIETSKNIGKISIKGIYFDNCEKILNITLTNNSTTITTQKFEKISDKLIEAHFDGNLNPDFYSITINTEIKTEQPITLSRALNVI